MFTRSKHRYGNSVKLKSVFENCFSRAKDIKEEILHGDFLYASVEVNTAYSWVTISYVGCEDIFMQGSEAEDFIEQVKKLYNSTLFLNEDECALWLAKPYFEIME